MITIRLCIHIVIWAGKFRNWETTKRTTNNTFLKLVRWHYCVSLSCVCVWLHIRDCELHSDSCGLVLLHYMPSRFLRASEIMCKSSQSHSGSKLLFWKVRWRCSSDSPVGLRGNQPSCSEVCKTPQTTADNWKKVWTFFGRNVLEIHNNTNTTTTPEYAEAGVVVVGKAAEAKALASLKIGEDKGKVLHSTSVPESEQTKGKMYTWVREFVE